MLKIYDYLDEVLHTEELIPEKSPELSYSIHEVMDQLGYKEESSYSEPLERTLKACMALGIPIKENFRKVYCFANGKMELDLRLSAIACYLFMINCNPNNPLVAKAQLLFMLRKATI
ncbi:hypothetical protein [Pinibacter aurantiacus]|uniref:Damage-inducible protein D n=1 Tax=Pinibacter aurantiacus TaxID=2851599 RepID=A0A9E2SB38_9BACT|nr:hypothetical protein [Pinibacter aurantiacus]MBV4358057.1 hypothetical protein [Pinibacter aurantiacus]